MPYTWLLLGLPHQSTASAAMVQNFCQCKQGLRAIKHRVKSSIKAKIQITTQPGNICIIYVLQVQEMENSFQTHNPTWVFNQSSVIRIKSTIDMLEAWLVVETARGRISASSYGFNQAICLLPCRAGADLISTRFFLTVALTSGVFVLISQSQSESDLSLI